MPFRLCGGTSILVPNEEVRDGRFRSLSGILVPLYGIPQNGKSGTEQRDNRQIARKAMLLLK
ncbi:MAG: hypothetical protein AABZ02_10855 [Bacteroidota bacterium]